jgi:hypothetical protein
MFMVADLAGETAGSPLYGHGRSSNGSDRQFTESAQVLLDIIVRSVSITLSEPKTAQAYRGSLAVVADAPAGDPSAPTRLERASGDLSRIESPREGGAREVLARNHSLLI